VFNNSSVLCVFDAAGTGLLSCCIATGPLHGSDKGTYAQTHEESRLPTEDLLEAVFSLWFYLKLYKRGQPSAQDHG
jgi:hypothetical protein